MQSPRGNFDDDVSDMTSVHEHRGVELERPFSSPHIEVQKVVSTPSATFAKEKPKHCVHGTVHSTSVQKTLHSRGTWRSWVPELVWLGFSVACFIVIVGVLSRFNNETVPNLPLDVTLNTVLAFLAMLVKTAFMIPVVECVCQLKWAWFKEPNALGDFQLFEDASRGPWGSTILLYRQWKSLASLGTVISIMAVVSSPLTQLMIAYPTRAVPTNGLATVPTIQVLGFTDVQNIAHDVSPFQHSVNQGWAASWLEKVKPVEATCPTGNCTFPDVRSFSVCSDARDITHSGYLDINFIANPSQSNLSFPSNFAGSEFTEGLLAYNMSLPDIFATNCSFVTQDPSSAFTCKFRPNQSIGFSDDENIMNSMLYSTAILYALPSNESNGTISDPKTDLQFRAIEAVLYLCTNTYEIVVSKGETQTNVKSSTNQVVSRNPPLIVNVTCYIDNMLYTQWCDMGHNISDSQESFSEPSDIIFLNTFSSPETTTNDWSAEFGGDIYFLEAIVNYIYPQISFYISADPSRSMENQYTAYNAGPAVNALDALMAAQNNTQQLENIQAMIENVGISLTNQMRILSPNFGLESAHAANGTAWISESFVEVRWGWSALLISEVTLSAVLIMATIIRTSRLSIQTVKSSALPALVALGQEGRASLGHLARGDDMNRKAKHIYVCLKDDELSVQS